MGVDGCDDEVDEVNRQGEVGYKFRTGDQEKNRHDSAFD